MKLPRKSFNVLSGYFRISIDCYEFDNSWALPLCIGVSLYERTVCCHWLDSEVTIDLSEHQCDTILGFSPRLPRRGSRTLHLA